MACSCNSTAQLCDECIQNRFAQLKGVAARRGEEWADDVTRRTGHSYRWPAGGKIVHAIAMIKVADLARDIRLREMLATEAAKWATKRWIKTRGERTVT